MSGGLVMGQYPARFEWQGNARTVGHAQKLNARTDYPSTDKPDCPSPPNGLRLIGFLGASDSTSRSLSQTSQHIAPKRSTTVKGNCKYCSLERGTPVWTRRPAILTLISWVVELPRAATGWPAT